MSDLVLHKPENIEGREVRVCKICGQAKPLKSFYKDSFALLDRGDHSGLSEDCRSCRIKERKVEKDVWLIEKGIKKSI